jgi:alpha-glucosidase
MNYDAFMEPVTWFLTGMEKHSDSYRDDLYQNGMAFFELIFQAMARMPTPSIYCAMNELSNHDHSRFMTRTNGTAGRLHTAGSRAADENLRPEVFREAVVIQMTWPGAPTFYYGDEAGLTGWTDPDNRRTYPWGREDMALIALHQSLAELREKLPTLKKGSVKPLCAGHGYIAYSRFDDRGSVSVACNNLECSLFMDLPLRDIGIPDDTRMQRVFSTDLSGFDNNSVPAGIVSDGILKLELPARCAVILVPEGTIAKSH